MVKLMGKLFNKSRAYSNLNINEHNGTFVFQVWMANARNSKTFLVIYM